MGTSVSRLISLLTRVSKLRLPLHFSKLSMRQMLADKLLWQMPVSMNSFSCLFRLRQISNISSLSSLSRAQQVSFSMACSSMVLADRFSDFREVLMEMDLRRTCWFPIRYEKSFSFSSQPNSDVYLLSTLRLCRMPSLIFSVDMTLLGLSRLGQMSLKCLRLMQMALGSVLQFTNEKSTSKQSSSLIFTCSSFLLSCSRMGVFSDSFTLFWLWCSRNSISMLMATTLLVSTSTAWKIFSSMASTQKWRRACRCHLLSVGEFGNCGKIAMKREATDMSSRLKVQLPQPRKMKPMAMLRAMLNPQWNTFESWNFFLTTRMIFRHSMSQVPAMTRERARMEALRRENSSYWSMQFLLRGSLANSHLMILMALSCSMCHLMEATASASPVPAYLRPMEMAEPVSTLAQMLVMVWQSIQDTLQIRQYCSCTCFRVLSKMNRISSGICFSMDSRVLVIESHMIRLRATVFSRMWLGLHSSIVLKLLGIEILLASSQLFDFRYISDRATSEAGAVMCRFTFGPSFMLEHLLSFTKFVLIIDWGGSICFPPSMNLISRSSSCRSRKLSLVSFMPRQIMPRAQPAASEYPSLSRHLSVQGFLPIWDRVISVMVRLQVPLWSRPIPMRALVCTLMGISRSTLGGSRTGMCSTRVFDKFSSDFPMLEALTPSRMATLVNSLFGFRYWQMSVGEKHFRYPNSPSDSKKPEWSLLGVSGFWQKIQVFRWSSLRGMTCRDSFSPAAMPEWNSGQWMMASLSSLRSRLTLISLGIMPLRLILGILMMSVMKERLVPRLKAPCPTSTETLRLANLRRMFWLSTSHLCSGMDSMSLGFTLISELEESSRSTSSNTRSLLILFISEALEVRKYSSEVEVCTRVLMCSSKEGFFRQKGMMDFFLLYIWMFLYRSSRWISRNPSSGMSSYSSNCRVRLISCSSQQKIDLMACGQPTSSLWLWLFWIRQMNAFCSLLSGLTRFSFSSSFRALKQSLWNTFCDNKGQPRYMASRAGWAGVMLRAKGSMFKLGSPLARVLRKLKMKLVRLKMHRMLCFSEFDFSRIWFMSKKKSGTSSPGMQPSMAAVLALVRRGQVWCCLRQYSTYSYRLQVLASSMMSSLSSDLSRLMVSYMRSSSHSRCRVCSTGSLAVSMSWKISSSFCPLLYLFRKIAKLSCSAVVSSRVRITSPSMWFWQKAGITLILCPLSLYRQPFSILDTRQSCLLLQTTLSLCRQVSWPGCTATAMSYSSSMEFPIISMSRGQPPFTYTSGLNMSRGYSLQAPTRQQFSTSLSSLTLSLCTLRSTSQILTVSPRVTPQTQTWFLVVDLVRQTSTTSFSVWLLSQTVWASTSEWGNSMMFFSEQVCVGRYAYWYSDSISATFADRKWMALRHSSSLQVSISGTWGDRYVTFSFDLYHGVMLPSENSPSIFTGFSGCRVRLAQQYFPVLSLSSMSMQPLFFWQYRISCSLDSALTKNQMSTPSTMGKTREICWSRGRQNLLPPEVTISSESALALTWQFRAWLARGLLSRLLVTQQIYEKQQFMLVITTWSSDSDGLSSIPYLNFELWVWVLQLSSIILIISPILCLVQPVLHSRKGQSGQLWPTKYQLIYTSATQTLSTHSLWPRPPFYLRLKLPDGFGQVIMLVFRVVLPTWVGYNRFGLALGLRFLHPISFLLPDDFLPLCSAYATHLKNNQLYEM